MPGKYHGKDARLYIAGYDLSPLMSSIEWSDEIEMDQYAVADGSGGYHGMPGLVKGSVKLDGMFDDNHQGILNNMLGATAGSQLVAVLGSAVGDAALGIESIKETRYNWPLKVTNANRLMAEFMADNSPVDVCRVLQPKATRTTDGSGTVLDNLAASANGLIAYLQVFACGADDALIVKVQSDTTSDFSTPTDVITFTTANGITAERKTAAGAIERYLRVSWSGTPAYSATFAVIVKRA
ncbi:MAG: hypothetical protein PHQ43_05745 [Dehalococcoidales bacterium]|nr:hypothetical protein [Dehalococcoidales bacterium]